MVDLVNLKEHLNQEKPWSDQVIESTERNISLIARVQVVLAIESENQGIRKVCIAEYLSRMKENIAFK